MNFRQRYKDKIELNVTPLIDVVFLLLIFFMVTTSFTRETQIAVELPEATGSDPSLGEQRLLEISINEKGEYFLNSEALINTEMETIIRALKREAGEKRDQKVIVSADAQVPYQSFITAMDAIGKVGFANVSLATRQPNDTN